MRRLVSFLVEPEGLWIAIILVVYLIAASGVDYHDSRNSGLLGAPAYSLSIGLLLLVPPTLLAAVLVWKKNRQG